MIHELLLRGPDGSNPLGFMSALGALRSLVRADSELKPKLSWRLCEGGWRPVLRTVRELGEQGLIDLLDDVLQRMKGHSAWQIGKNLNVSPGDYRIYASKAMQDASPADSTHAEFAAAFASESVMDGDGDDAVVSDTALRTMSGAGHQHFVGFMRQLVEQTNSEHIRKSLFEYWRYDDDKPSLRWDPQDDRRYALRWNEPSDDPIKTMRGANRLAIEALPLLPVMPTLKRLETTGFLTGGSRATYWTWPVWGYPASVDVVRSLLTDKRLRAKEIDYRALARVGVMAVFRSQRVTVGKYRNFTAGTPA